jgi:hypothetical protein
MVKVWQKPQRFLFLPAAEKMFIPVVERFKVQEEMIETKNFVPEALMIYHFQDINRSIKSFCGITRVSEGDERMLSMLAKPGDSSNPFDEEEPFLYLAKKAKDEEEADDDEDDDEEWDDEDEDDDDEDWDEDVEDDDWEDDDEEWDEDEDEDWDEDDEEGDDEDWGEEEN